MSSKFIKEVKRDHRQSADVHRHLNESAKIHDEIDAIRDRQQRFDSDTAEIDALFKTTRRYPTDDPRRIAAQKRLDYLHSWRHGLYVEIAAGLKQFLRMIGREVFSLLMMNLRFLFIVLVNVVFFGFLIALLFAWAAR